MITNNQTQFEPGPSLGTAFDFLRLLWAVDHALQQKSVQMHRTIGVTGPQRLVIRIVGRLPGITVGRLAKVIGSHPSAATGLAKRLIRDGLLRARPDPRDGRRLRLGLTAAGQAIEATAAGTIEEAIRQLYEGTPPADMATTAQVLRSLGAILKANPPSRSPVASVGAKRGRSGAEKAAR